MIGVKVACIALATAGMVLSFVACGSMMQAHIEERTDAEKAEFFGSLNGYATCGVWTKTDDFTDVVSHFLSCAPTKWGRGDGEMTVACTPAEDQYLIIIPAGSQSHTEGMVEVTYRFDDQPLSREQWEYNGYQVFSYESVDQVLDGISSANQFVFQVGSGTTTEIKLAGFGGADGRRAGTTFLQRCKPSTE